MITALIASLSLLAAPAPPSAVGGGSDLDGDGAADRVRVESREKGVWLVVDTGGGVRAERALGDAELPFQLDGRESRLTVRDVTGDGRPEIVVAASAAGRGLLYVLRLRRGALESLRADAEAFVSDTGSFPDGLSLDSEGRVTVAGVSHSGRHGPREALFTFEWSEKTESYRLAATDFATD